MQKYAWNSIKEQEFSEELKYAYRKILEEKQAKLEELRTEKQELKNTVAEAAVRWKLSYEFDKNLQTKTEEKYRDLGKAIEKYEKYEQNSEKICEEHRLTSEIEWLRKQIE